MSDSSEDDNFLTPPELVETVKNAELSFLPSKSREKYLKVYEHFDKWRHEKGAGNTMSETVLLSYFIEMSHTKQPSTMWSIYSMLNATLQTKNNVHINTYAKLIAFLKRSAVGHKSKKSKVFTAANIEKFLNEAPDCTFLAAKVILIIGINGACRSNELLNLTPNAIEQHSSDLLLINLPNTKTNIDRSFVVREEYAHVVQKYKALRPPNTITDRFFIQYRNGKCTRQPMGINKIGATAREIATFLDLKEPQLYTGHCFRRTSATLLADGGADLTTLKRHGGWRSSTVAEGYIEDSIENKSKICKRIIDSINLKQTSHSWAQPSTSSDANHTQTRPESPTFTVREGSQSSSTHNETSTTTQVANTTTITVPNKTVTFNLQNCTNFTFHF
ncbi:uncharacterized protein LOC113229237 [Hyposmocoma kahamanoa]|uniref:uncharacterized protein LOC113229237 n=1 Tax=Hyposmocoma kahamanoa TaxID=1477025 RepID=UPI000E6DA10F|nr:uncharacterized protein LOC113229237 [Hyposmocoma kahamanoa]